MSRSGHSIDPSARNQAIAGVNGFVAAECGSLNRIRTSNRFHYGASVPYLPFAQADVDLFESVIAAAVAGTQDSSVARN